MAPRPRRSRRSGRSTIPRVRSRNLPERSPYPADPELAWMVRRLAAVQPGRGSARGAWIAPLRRRRRVHARPCRDASARSRLEHRLEFVYGDLRDGDPAMGPGRWSGRGLPVPGWHLPRLDPVRGEADFIRLRRGECWRVNEPTDWNLWRRMIEAGVRDGPSRAGRLSATTPRPVIGVPAASSPAQLPSGAHWRPPHDPDHSSGPAALWLST
jgi:hypothetical protein